MENKNNEPVVKDGKKPEKVDVIINVPTLSMGSG